MSATEHVQVEQELDVPVDLVWVLVRNFGDTGAWLPDATAISWEGRGVGATRRVQSSLGRFMERCTAYDEAEHRFSYELPESPFPFDHIESTVRLTAFGEGRSTIIWSAEFSASPEHVEMLRASLEQSYTAFISTLRKTLAEAGYPTISK